MKTEEIVNKILTGGSVKNIIDCTVRKNCMRQNISESAEQPGPVDEQSFINPPQKSYKPIDRLSSGLKILKKLHKKGAI